jgi:hypothetical protein
MKTEFSTLEVGRALKIGRECFRDWMNKGFIKPSVPSKGQGSKAIFLLDNVIGIALFKHLVEIGLTRAIAASWAYKFIERDKTEPDRQKAHYIAFVSSINLKEVKVYTFASGDFAITLESLQIIPPGNRITDLNQLPLEIREKLSMSLDKNWQYIHIVNVKALRANVLKALAKL